ncbi:MAG TPA: hypothetical protein VLF40_03925 [Candidatus Saccharimonadales bacterium]|nr:hypothetical protein [Candidatus Saccharimonadales bacterium]
MNAQPEQCTGLSVGEFMEKAESGVAGQSMHLTSPLRRATCNRIIALMQADGVEIPECAYEADVSGTGHYLRQVLRPIETQEVNQ